MSQLATLLLVLQFLQASGGRRDRDSRGGDVGPGPQQSPFSCKPLKQVLHTALSSLSREEATVLGLLANLDFLHHSPEGGAMTGSVFLRRTP